MIVPQHSSLQRRPARAAFTLIELLIVVLVISILAATVMFAMMAAQEQGRRARTRAQITKISECLARQWDSYRTRRVPVFIPLKTGPKAAAKIRLDALRELMRMEMPDRKSDLSGPAVLASEPALLKMYKSSASSKWNTDYQGAECLYLILKHLKDENGTALDFFSDAEIGDVDGDKMPEILDGWGTPIRFLRWAPGFNSFIQGKNPVNAVNPPSDPFDPMGVYPGGFALFPLVISAGPDKVFDIVFGTEEGLSYADTDPPNDPFMTIGNNEQLGQIKDMNDDGEISMDDVHNHMLQTKVQ